MAAIDPTEDTEQLSPRIGHREIHYHNGQSQKIVWAWAAFATGLACAVIGGAAMYFASQQASTNQSVASALTTQSVAIGKIETKVETLQSTVERLERTVERQ